MKNLVTSVFFFLSILSGFSQGVSVNENGLPADASAMLDISSHTKGILVPRLRTIERTAIVSPAEGLLVYDIDMHSFWYAFGGVWKQILNNSSPILPLGPAGGDLTGNYPTPTVAKIQNLDVSAGFPFDKQVLKWDGLNNQWKGKNDSLFLPYNVAFGSATKLFGITNNNTTGGSSAIFGRSGSIQSGINPGFTMGVWGDNSNGMGVAGTSSSSSGVFGSSIYNHGIVGYSGNSDFAGVYGSHEEYHGIGVMGETEADGYAVFGRLTGPTGIAMFGQVNGPSGNAGVFQSTSPAHTDTTFIASTSGLGTLGSFMVTNTANAKPVVDIYHAGNGTGLKIRMIKQGAAGNGIDILSQGSGNGIYSRSETGVAGKFEIVNSANGNPALFVGNQGIGTSLYVTSLQQGITAPAIDVFSLGTGGGLNVSAAKGKAGMFYTGDATATNETVNVTTVANAKNAIFKSDHQTTGESNIYVEQNGLGKGIDILMTKTTNTKAGVYVNTAGNKGIEVVTAGALGVTSTTASNGAIAVYGNTGSTANNAVGVKGITGLNASNGVGVMGIAGANDTNGIGVKGIAGGGINGGIGVLGEGNAANPNAIGVKGTSYTHNEDVGAVTGINLTDGVGVYGESVGADGIGIVGVVGNTGNHSVAALFKNNYTNNDRAVVELISNGKGNAIFADNTNLGGNAPQLRIRNAGTGEFLKFETNLGALRTKVTKEGNIETAGTMTVKGDKGIVRNSTGTQMRTEFMDVTIPAGDLNHYDDQFNPTIIQNITFGSAFTSAPFVTIGNSVSGSMQGITLTIDTVTPTGCKLRLQNFTPYNYTYDATVIRIMVIGAE